MVITIQLSGKGIPEASNAIARLWVAAHSAIGDVYRAFSTKTQVRKVEVEHELQMMALGKLKVAMDNNQWQILKDAAKV